MQQRLGPAVLVLALALTACADDSGDTFGVVRTPPPADTTSAAPALTEAQVRAYFLEVAFARTEHIEKWVDPIRVAVRGGTAADRQDVAALISELRSLTGLDIALADDGDANFEVAYLTQAEWPARLGGWTTRDGVITSGSVNVEAYATAAERRGALRQRFLMAMGFGRVDELQPGSIFTYGTSATALTATDREVVRRFYHPAVLPRMTRQEVVAALGY